MGPADCTVIAICVNGHEFLGNEVSIYKTGQAYMCVGLNSSMLVLLIRSYH